jgi:hypothetical protein
MKKENKIKSLSFEGKVRRHKATTAKIVTFIYGFISFLYEAAVNVVVVFMRL